MIETVAPVFSSHGHYRKTHLLADAAADTLCSARARWPQLLLSQDEAMPISTVAEYLGSDADGFACAVCKRIALRLAATGGVS